MSNESPAPDEQESPSGVYFDFDSYLFDVDPDIQPETHEIATILLSRHRSPSTFELLNTYYFQLRGAVTLWGRDDSLLAKLKDIRRTLLNEAARLTAVHLRTGHAISPRWVGIARDELLPIISETFPDASRVQLVVDQVPRLQMRATPDRRIRVSAFTREFYFHFNLCLWNLVLNGVPAIYEEAGPALQSLRAMLPYFIHMNDYVPVSRLPQLAAADRRALDIAYRATHVQMLFLLAHEYGHLFHNHEQHRSRDSAEALQREFAADEFALTHLANGLADTWNHVFFPSYRWIFQIQQLDEIVGSLLRGQQRQVETLSFDQRKNQLYAHLPFHRLTKEINVHEVHGTVLLIQLKGCLFRLGAERLSGIARELTRDLSEGQPRAWWEELPDDLMTDLFEAQPATTKEPSDDPMHHPT